MEEDIITTIDLKIDIIEDFLKIKEDIIIIEEISKTKIFKFSPGPSH